MENDREFDVGAILRKIKRGNYYYPKIVIIPKIFQRFAWRFQASGIYVWYWTATCKWLCRDCNETTTSSSSITPSRCSKCKKGSNFLSWIGIIKVKFEKAKNNPPLSYEVARKKAIDDYSLEVKTGKGLFSSKCTNFTRFS